MTGGCSVSGRLIRLHIFSLSGRHLAAKIHVCIERRCNHDLHQWLAGTLVGRQNLLMTVADMAKLRQPPLLDLAHAGRQTLDKNECGYCLARACQRVGGTKRLARHFIGLSWSPILECPCQPHVRSLFQLVNARRLVYSPVEQQGELPCSGSKLRYSR